LDTETSIESRRDSSLGPSTNKENSDNHLDQTIPQKQFEMYPYKIYNKLEDNYHLSNKKALFLNMKNFYEGIGEDPFISVPVTFHVKEGLEDPEFIRFK